MRKTLAFVFTSLLLVPLCAQAQKSKVRYAIVGLDHDHVWGILKDLAEVPQTQLVAIADPNPELVQKAKARVPEVALEADREWGRLTGRSWGVLERYRCDGARTVLATMGSMCGTARDAVDAMREAGRAVGLLKLRLFRPLPVEALRAALAGVPEVIVLDRNYSPGHGGVLHQELRAALYGMPDAPRIHGLLAGVGGVNVSAQRIAELVAQQRAGDAGAESVWVE